MKERKTHIFDAYPSQKSHCDGPYVDMTENHPQDTVKPRKADFIRPKYFICYRHIFSIANLKDPKTGY